MKKNLMYACNRTIKTLLVALFCTALISGCNRDDDEDPLPNPQGGGGGTDTTLASNFNGDGTGVVSYWASSGDGTELTTGAMAIAPGKATPDSSYHLVGTDTDADWWMGTVLGHGNAVFGLPADTSKISIKFDVYAVNATSNVEIQLQETDGDAFTYNLGSEGVGLTLNGWKTVTAPLGQFTLASWAKAGDNVLNSASLKNISFALISGVQTGNTAEVYIDNVEFIIEE